MEKELNCYLCEREFCEKNLPRMLPACCHTYCEACIRKLMKVTDNGEVMIICPQDHNEMEFQDTDINHFPKNIGLIKLITNKVKPKEVAPKAAEDLNIKEKHQAHTDHKQAPEAHHHPSHSHHHIQKPIQPVHPMPRSGPIPKKSNLNLLEQFTKPTPPTKIFQLQKPQQPMKNSDHSQKIEELCLIHNKPLDIICIKDLAQICSNCAIFGDHKGHEFKSIQQVMRDKINKEQDIIYVIDQKDALDRQLTSLERKNVDAKLIKNKKEALLQSIHNKFMKLRLMLDESEKKTVEKFNKYYKGVQTKISLQSKSIERPLQQYSFWQIKAMKVIDELEEPDNLKKQILILNYDRRSEETDIVREGEVIIEKIEQTDREIKQFQQSLLDDIKLEFNEEIYKSLGEFCDIKSASQICPPEFTLHATPHSAPLAPPSSDDLLLEAEVGSSFDKSYGLNGESTNVEFIPFNPNISIINPEPIIPIQSKIIKRESPERHESIRLGSSDRSNQRFLSGNKDPKSPGKGDLFPTTSAFHTAPIIMKPQEWAKKKQKMGLAEKYEKQVEGIVYDTVDQLDLTNAQLGDQMVLQILELMRGKKVKTLKMIRNKLSDDILTRMWEYLGNIVTLNLSQNNFSDRVLESFLQNRHKMPVLKSLILSQNKINQRNVRVLMEEIRKTDVTLSL